MATGHLLQHLVIIRNELNDDRIKRNKLRGRVDHALAELKELKARQAILRAFNWSTSDLPPAT
jgi:hypothetical protein